MFWRPSDSEQTGDLTLVGAIASDRAMYILVDGPGLPPPTGPDSEPPDMPWMRVSTASGVEVKVWSGGGGGGGLSDRPRTLLYECEVPPQPDEPLVITLVRNDGSTIWQMVAVPLGA